MSDRRDFAGPKTRARDVNGLALVVAGLVGLLGSVYDATAGEARTSGFQLALVVALFGGFITEGVRELRTPVDADAPAEIRWLRIVPAIAFAAFAVAYFGFGVG